MPDDFDRIESALADIARALRVLKIHPPSAPDATIRFNQIARAADVIKRHADELKRERDLAELQARRRRYAP